MARSRIPRRGFYANPVNRALVFAYDFDAGDAVWLRHGQHLDKVLDEDQEAVWELPANQEELDAFADRYNFERISSADARPHIVHYLKKVCDELLSPETNKEIVEDPNLAIQFVRAVKNFMLDVEEIA
jgi:hypothetical protein